ncbi:MAG: hypothetical protein AMXMBFR64_60220 [Myxococcales bacterium]
MTAEQTAVHTRLLKCALEVEPSRAFWAHADGAPVTPARAFEGYWFGARSLPRTEDLLAIMRARYEAYPAALAVLHRWSPMGPDTRRLVCHWHLQLADPLYRAFTGAFLPARRSARPSVTRDLVVTWVGSQVPARWTLATRIKFASKLLSAAHAAGLVATTRDPRPLALPRVPDDALAYLLHLLRETSFEGTLLDNPYLRSVGLAGAPLEDRLRALPGVSFRRQGDLVDLAFAHDGLAAWAAALCTPPAPAEEAAP